MFYAALAGNFLCNQEAPDGFVGIEGMAGFSDFFFGHILFAARPGVAAVLDAVERNLRVFLTTVEQINLGVFAALQRGELALRWLLGAVVQTGPFFGAVFGGEEAQHAVLVAAAIVGNDGIVGAIHEEHGNRS